MDDQDMVDDNVLLLLGRLGYKNLYLPCVNTVKVNMSGTCTTRETHYAIENAQTIAKFIEAAAPNAHNVHIKHGEYPVTRGKGYWTAVNSFTGSLYGMSQTYSLDIGTHYHTFQNGFCEGKSLTSLSFAWCECSSNAFKLLDTHSATLQELSIHGIHTHDISRLLVNESERPIIYPYLLSLTLNGQNDIIETADRPAFKSTTPFPRLVRLNANIVYPFGDDVLFRGNSSTLEELSFNFDCRAMTTINNARVFVPGKYKKLNTVKVCSFIEDIDYNERQVKQHISLLQNIAPTIQSLHICDIDISQCFIGELSKSKLFKNINTLNLGELHLALSDVVGILKTLPVLQHLESGLAESLAIASKSSFGNLDQLCSRYSEVSRCFSQWTVSQDSIVCTASSALYAVVLASICPKFTNVCLPDQHKCEYFELVKQFTENQHLLKHSGIQSRLLSIKSSYNSSYV
ncbi:hypothetical protein IW140_000777 [Coemansia sp. RSA 1813]|nr:hypothetical protein EV178_000719 [Coemansia sp. RSA 1646]KAJ2092338.1 hypothetical protein IW138_001100 [Coemansia sp. RSA 986]KAJ2572662.1 hypothetical protein IW140_000777 [Coemansia sp. RSA 1813]